MDAHFLGQLPFRQAIEIKGLNQITFSFRERFETLVKFFTQYRHDNHIFDIGRTWIRNYIHTKQLVSIQIAI